MAVNKNFKLYVVKVVLFWKVFSEASSCMQGNFLLKWLNVMKCYTVLYFFVLFCTVHRFLSVPGSSLSCHSCRIGLCSMLPTLHNVIQLVWPLGASHAFSSVRLSIHGYGACILLMQTHWETWCQGFHKTQWYKPQHLGMVCGCIIVSGP